MERRKHKRYPYIAIISHDILSPDAAAAGKIYSFSQSGLYFESKHIFQEGEEVFVEIIGHPQPRIDLEFLFDVIIVWRRKSQSAKFPYGYGARFKHPLESIKNILGYSKANSRTFDPPEPNLDDHLDARHSPRKPYQKPLLFNYKNHVCRGLVTDISQGGAFIKTTARISLGYKIKLVMVKTSGTIRRKVKLRGWVVRLTPKGFGVSFNRRSGLERRFDIDRRTGFDRRDGRKPHHPPFTNR